MALSRKERIILIAGIGPPLISIAYDVIKDIPVFSTIVSIGTWAVKSVFWLLTFEIQLWIFLIFFFGFIYLAIYLSNKEQKKQDNEGFNFLNYRTDTIDGLKWTWEYVYDNTISKHVIKEQRAYCPRCDSIMRGQNNWIEDSTTCIRCSYRFNRNVYQDVNKIDLLIIDNIDKLQKASIPSV